MPSRREYGKTLSVVVFNVVELRYLNSYALRPLLIGLNNNDDDDDYIVVHF